MTGPCINLHLGSTSVIRGVPSGALHICAVGTHTTCTSSSVQSTALRRISA